MTVGELQIELKNLSNEPVTFKRIAGNSIILYFFGIPGDENTISLFIHPSWRYEKQDKVIMGSGDFPWESDAVSTEQYRQSFDNLCSLTNNIFSAKLIDFKIDLVSLDITLTFSGGQLIRQFSSEVFDCESWVYHNHRKNIVAYVSPSGISEKHPVEAMY
jgi:hypothetical protein